jgi:hypothetical protein
MASVYRHALVTLAASTASCASQGFSEVAVDSWKSGWWQYRMKSVVEVPFERAGGSESDGAVMIRVRNSPEHVDHESRVPSLDTLPLNRRGWALQESILSTRVVAFEDSELTWRCNSGTTCECKAVDFPTPTMQRRSIQSLGSKTEVYQFWRYCVARYSWCRLTDLSDKFPAISGIASAVYQLTGSQFVAGIWSDDLAKCLAWTRNYAGDRHLFPSFPQPRETPTMTAPTSNVYHAPTFSWASIDGNGVVSYEVMDSLTSQWKDAECVLVDHEVRLKGQNRFGAVSGGSITIRGMTLPAEAIFASMTLGDYQPFIRSERLTQCMHADLDEPCGVFKLDKNDPDANEFGPLPARQETWSQFCCEQSSQGTYGKPIEKSPARRQYLEAFWEGTERK